MTTIVLALSAAVTIATAGHAASGGGATYYVDATRGDDSGPGSANAPWRTLSRANRAAPGATVQVEAGTYDDAPTAPGVHFYGATGKSSPARVVTETVKLSGRGTRLTGLTLAEGLDLEGGARDNVVDHCRIEDHLGIWGGHEAAPRNNRITRTRMILHELAAHTDGDDRDRDAPRIVAPSFEDCDITVKRSEGVLWRWSGVDDARIVRTTIRLVNGGSHNDDDASWKWLYVRRASIVDSRIVLDNSGDFGGTGPFAPMWRDSTWGTRMVRTTIEAKRGGMIFSPNTAGTWVCSCGANRFENVVLRAPGTILFYQCPRPGSDTWVRSRIEAGRFDEYNTRTMPSGLTVHAGARHSK